jgi:pyruvate formate lyase activating enzyme
VTGKIHSFETFGAADGPGVRFIVFMHGCGFRCAYCHNPDTWACPPTLEISVEELLAKAMRYRDYWGEDGGITLSGGEPMLQAQFAANLFERAHELGISTCLDTAAGPFRRDDPDIIRLLNASDTVLLDIKAFDCELHRTVTECGNENVIDCARYLSEIMKPVWIRRVLVPGLTDGEDDLLKTGGFIRTLRNVEKVEILPYHGMGEAKWESLGMRYRLDGTIPPDPAAVAKAASLLDVKGCASAQVHG